MSLRLAVLGDSIAHGTGATRPADALGPRLAAALTAAGHPAALRVVAVPGARSAHLADQVTAAAGWRPELALVVVGANDLTHQVPVGQVVADLRSAVRRLRALGTEVVVLPAPDLSVVAHVPPAYRALVRALSGQLRAAQSQAAQEEGVRVVHLGQRVADRFAAEPALFSADRFHPSSAGYAVIAEAVAPVLTAAAAVATTVADTA